MRFRRLLKLLAALSCVCFAIAPSPSRGSGCGVHCVLQLAGGPTALASTLAGLSRHSITSHAGTAWRDIGPPGGDINSLAVDPVNPSTAYVAAGRGGVFKSTDGGKSWIASGLAGIPVNALAVDPSSRATIYAAAGYGGRGGGLEITADGGKTWKLVTKGLASSNCLGIPDLLSLAVDPRNGSILYAGSDCGGMFKSTDGGASWQAASSGLGSPPLGEWLAVAPSSPSTVYAATEGSGAFVSTNAGGTWKPVNSGLASNELDAVTVDPENAKRAWVGTEYSGGVFATSNGGTKWTVDNSGLPAVGKSGPSVSFLNAVPGKLYAVAGGLFRQTSGFSWKSIPIPDYSANVLAADPAQPSSLYLGTRSGVFLTTNAGSSWKLSVNGILANPTLAIAIDPANSQQMYAGTQDGGLYTSSDGGGGWTQALLYGSPLGAVPALAVNPTKPSTVWAGDTFGDLFESTNSGSTWTETFGFEKGLPNCFCPVVALAVSAAAPNSVYVAFNGAGVYETTNGGGVWMAKNTGLTNLKVTGLAVSPSAPAHIYVGTGDGVFSTLNAGTSWNQAKSSVGLPVTAIAVGPPAFTSRPFAERRPRAHAGRPLYSQSDGRVSIGTDGQVYYSDDGGKTLNPAAVYDLNGRETSVVPIAFWVSEDGPDRILVTMTGWFKSTDDGLSWKEFPPDWSAYGSPDGGAAVITEGKGNIPTYYFLPTDEGTYTNTTRSKLPPNAAYDIADQRAACPCPPFPPQPSPRAGGDPVSLYNGQLQESSTDLTIPARGFDFSFQCTYDSGNEFLGPLGYKWDFNYNRRLVVANSTNLSSIQAMFSSAKIGDVERVASGSARADLYRLNSNGTYTDPLGTYTRLTKNASGGYSETDRSGFTWIYAPADPDTGTAAMTAMTDRDGNTMTFQYNDEGQLVTVVDTLGRPIHFAYRSDGLLTSITDFSGRTVTFGYTGDYLTTVTSPAVTGTPNGNNFPSGRTVAYTYYQTDPSSPLNADITAIESPNQVAAGVPALQARVRLTYDSNPSSPAFNRVLSEALGGAANGVPAGGTITYAYRSLSGNMQDPNGAVTETDVTDRDGNDYIYRFDSFGSIVLAENLANRRVDPTAPGPFITTYTYDPQNRLLSETDPLGNKIVYGYDSSNPDRLQQGNLLSETQIPYSARAGDQKSISTSWTYEPIFNQVRTTTDPRGFTTKNTFDYEEACNFATIGARVGMTAAEAQSALSAAGMCKAPLGDVNGDGITNQVHGDVIRVQRPTVALGTACPNAYLTPATIGCSFQARQSGSSTQQIVDLYRYNQYGQRTRSTDPEGNVTTFAYYPADTPGGPGTRGAGDASTGGYLKQRIVDAFSIDGRDSGTNPAPALITTSYAYNNVGDPTQIADGRGVATDFIYNQDDEVVQVSRAAAHGIFSPKVTEPQPLTDYKYLRRFFYDADGNLVLSQVEDRGDLSGASGPPAAADLPANITNPNPSNGPDFVDTVYKYDALDHPIQEVQTVRDGSNPLFLYTNYRYDPNGNLVLLIKPAGNAVSSVYDERNLLYQQTAGATHAPSLALMASTDPTGFDVRGGVSQVTTYHHDANGNLASLVDGDGRITHYVYDGFDRRTAVIDPSGDETISEYDADGNLIRSASFGPVGGASRTTTPTIPLGPVSVLGVIQSQNLVSTSLLSAVGYQYDSLNRQTQVSQSLFVNSEATVRPPDVRAGAKSIGKLNLNPGTCSVPGLVAPPGHWLGCVSDRTEYDADSRPTFAVNDSGDVGASFYDGAGRLIKTVDPAGNLMEYAYDGDGNLIETRQTDKAQIPAVTSEVFLTTNFYDSLDRLTESMDNIGETTYYRYDSRDNLIATADAKGPAGPVVTRRVFPPGPRTMNRTNLPGNVTSYTYDGLDRPTSQVSILTKSGLGDGTFSPAPDPLQGSHDGLITLLYSYDSNSNIATETDSNGNQTQYAYDNVDDPVKETIGTCVSPKLATKCIGPVSATATYDGAGLQTSRTDENGTVTTYGYDLAERLTSASIKPAKGIVGTTRMTYQYDGLGRLTSAFDSNKPNVAGDRVTTGFSYDSVGRTIEERQQIGSSRPEPVDSAWRGDGLRSALTYPNGRATDYTYDADNRIATISDAGAAKPLATYSYIGRDRVLQRSYPQNGTIMTYANPGGTQDAGYDGLGRPIKVQVLGPTQSQILGYAYTYDRTGNPVSKSVLQAPNLSELYRYDSANRLITFQRGTLNSTRTSVTTVSFLTPPQSVFKLDGAGNWLKVDGETRTFNSYNGIVTRTASGRTTNLTNDANGNIDEGGTYAYAWDGQNRLVGATRSSDGKLVASYLYDGLGRRVQKTVTNSGSLNGVTRFNWDGENDIEDTNGAGAVATQFVYGLGIDNPIVLDRTLSDGKTQRLFYEQDSQGSVVGLTDAAGKLVEGYGYDAYGRPLVFDLGKGGGITWSKKDSITSGGPSGLGNPFLFTGQRFDPETGLYYDRARYMDPVLGRFISMDPLYKGYEYAGGDPTAASDPTGLQDLGNLTAQTVSDSGSIGAVTAQTETLKDQSDVMAALLARNSASSSAVQAHLQGSQAFVSPLKEPEKYAKAFGGEVAGALEFLMDASMTTATGGPGQIQLAQFGLPANPLAGVYVWGKQQIFSHYTSPEFQLGRPVGYAVPGLAVGPLADLGAVTEGLSLAPPVIEPALEFPTTIFEPALEFPTTIFEPLDLPPLSGSTLIETPAEFPSTWLSGIYRDVSDGALDQILGQDVLPETLDQTTIIGSEAATGADYGVLGEGPEATGVYHPPTLSQLRSMSNELFGYEADKLGIAVENGYTGPVWISDEGVDPCLNGESQ